jgi:hypothetical protein
VFDVSRGPALAKKQAKKQSDGKTVEFVETFEFTTAIKGSAAPKIELKPVGSGFALASASADLSIDRIDKHSVVISLAPNYDVAVLALYNQNVNAKLRRIENATRLVPLQ